VFGILSGQVDGKWWGLVGFLAGKGFSYFASALLHIYPFKTVRGVTNALILDLIGVSESLLSRTHTLHDQLLLLTACSGAGEHLGDVGS